MPILDLIVLTLVKALDVIFLGSDANDVLNMNKSSLTYTSMKPLCHLMSNGIGIGIDT